MLAAGQGNTPHNCVVAHCTRDHKGHGSAGKHPHPYHLDLRLSRGALQRLNWRCTGHRSTLAAPGQQAIEGSAGATDLRRGHVSP